jgi:hypothetical protein
VWYFENRTMANITSVMLAPPTPRDGTHPG